MAKYNRLENDFALNGMDGSYDANAYGVSAETGYRFNFKDGGLYVEPQVGVAYSRMTGDTFETGNGVTIAQDDYDSFIGRVGVRTGFKFPKDKGTIYARVSGVYDFQGMVNGTAFKDKAVNTIEEDLAAHGSKSVLAPTST
jgi:outer membrane autotransporter protein